MYSVALVQNQSEMAHYSYADTRPVIREFGYEVVLYTADNIDELRQALARKRFDAVVFGSNALNDKSIRSETAKPEFQETFRSWLSTGRGFLSFHQLRLAAQPDASLPFLPAPLCQVAPIVRPLSEQSATGSVAVSPGSDDHVALLYPHAVDPEMVRRQALSFKSLPGLYWHYWTNVNLGDWDSLLVDPKGATGSRSLVLSAKESEGHRVVLSALTLDWQHQRALLHNLLTYVVEGRHNTAVLIEKGNANIAFDYLLGTLRSRKFPFRSYLAQRELSGLNKHLTSGVHRTLLVGPFVDRDSLPPELNETIRARVASGQLKLLAVEGDSGGPLRFSVAGRERYALRLLQSVELSIQGELRCGYVDGSFWATAETLQRLEGMRERSGTYAGLVGETLRLAGEHNRNGSYDEVFGVSCALLWMHARYLGELSPTTTSTVSWIRSRVGDYELREQVLAYTTLAEIGLLQPGERERLTAILSQLTMNGLSEIDVIVYLRAALLTQTMECVGPLVSALHRLQQNGLWIDLATSATAATILMDVLPLLTKQPTLVPLRPIVESMIFEAVIRIQDALPRSPAQAAGAYLWDGKASTTIKCLQAWLRLDELIDLPVYELVAELSSHDALATQTTAGKTALSVLETVKKENQDLRRETAIALLKLARDRAAARRGRQLLFASVILLYVFCALVVALGSEAATTVISVFRHAYVDSWPFHLAFAGVFAAIMVLPWRTWITWMKGQHDAA